MYYLIVLNSSVLFSILLISKSIISLFDFFNPSISSINIFFHVLKIY